MKLRALLLWLLLPAGTASAAPAYDYLADLTAAPLFEIKAPAPAPAEDGEKAYENPPCIPHAELQPGRSFSPVVSDARRERAIKDLLAKIAVCGRMPYDNDGNVHSKPRPGLPKKPSGYYLEYTLIVPGRPAGAGPEPVLIGGVTYTAGPVLSARGAERLLIGGGREVYYTPDHYTTFVYLAIVR